MFVLNDNVTNIQQGNAVIIAFFIINYYEL